MLLVNPESAAAQLRDRTFDVARDLPLYTIDAPLTLVVLTWDGVPRDRPLYSQDAQFVAMATARGFAIAKSADGAHRVHTGGSRPEGAFLACHHLLTRP